MGTFRACAACLVSFLGTGAASAGGYAPLGNLITYDAGLRCAAPRWTVTDLNRDGRRDVVLGISPTTMFTSVSSPGELTIWMGQADGTLSEQTRSLFKGSVTSAYGFSGILAGDLNGDGIPDIFVPDPGLDTYVNGIPVGPWLGSTPKVAMSSGASFVDASAALAGMPSLFAHSAALADVNRDGSLDVYVGSISGADRTPYLLINDGRGNFVRDQSRLPATVTQGLAPLVEQPDGSKWGSSQQFSGSTFVDFNNDGAPDLVLLASNSTSHGLVLINDGHGDFSKIPSIDLPAGLYGSGLTRYQYNSDGSITISQAPGPGTVSLEAVALDINNDGYPDLVVTQTLVDDSKGVIYHGGKLQILINQQGKGFVDETASRGAPGFDATANYDSYLGTLNAFDVNGDGFPDLVAMRALSNGGYETHVFLNDGAGHFQRASVPGLPLPGFLAPLSTSRDEPIRIASFNIVNTRLVQTPGGTVAACDLAVQVYQMPVQVIEFYNTKLDNYFITADPNEAAAIDGGSAGPGWTRTGNTFRSGGNDLVCRFYGSIAPGPNSHFYTVDANECASLKQLQAITPATQKRWNFESLDFLTTAPANGTCRAGTTPVYRAYNNGSSRRVDSNHRITSSRTAIQDVVARGWTDEGVVMCAPN